jgi:hypothetical protein
MQPARLAMSVPETGFSGLKDSGSPKRCVAVPPGRWIRKSAGAAELFVHAEGPSGSGRFWRVSVGVGDAGQSAPARGFCLETSTAGWRTLRQFGRTPLPWLLDVDADEIPELIIWESFALAADASPAQEGLVAWAYRFDAQGAFTLQWNASRVMARELAAAYRTPLPTNDRSLAPARSAAARALEAFANAECTIGESPPATVR